MGVTVTQICRRCDQPFNYVRVTRLRFYCPDPCTRLEHLDNCRIASRKSYQTKVKPQRIAEREAKRAAGTLRPAGRPKRAAAQHTQP
jgi:hypothetical protein